MKAPLGKTYTIDREIGDPRVVDLTNCLLKMLGFHYCSLIQRAFIKLHRKDRATVQILNAE